MASLEIKGMTEFEVKLARLGDMADAAARAAVYKAAGIVADAVRQRLEGLEEELPVHAGDRYRYVPPGGSFRAIPSQEKRDLLAGLGVTPISPDEDENWNAKVGFEARTENQKGYDGQPTKKYPKGRPLLMIARSVESGTSMRPKQPFFRPAVDESKKKAVEAMNQAIVAAQEKIMK